MKFNVNVVRGWDWNLEVVTLNFNDDIQPANHLSYHCL